MKRSTSDRSDHSLQPSLLDQIRIACRRRGYSLRTEQAEGFGAADDPVFCSQKTDGPLSRSQLWRIVRRAAERAGLREAVSPHWLRHAHASHALDRGAPAHLVKETLGHESLATTSKYTHARPDDSSAQYLPV